MRVVPSGHAGVQFRCSAAIQRFHRAFVIAREELILFSLWWAVATLTTVGYGDVYPITPGGRLFTFLILIVGLGVISETVRKPDSAQHVGVARMQ